jgi:hypothetical protein
MTTYNTRTQNGTAPEPTADAGDRQRVPVAGGVLVYESRDLGRELVGFEDVQDWDNVADALRARGHGTGAIYHLPELDAEGSA